MSTQPTPEWQPIATAPKDGKEIDVWASGRRWTDVSWHGKYWFAPHGIYDCGAEMEAHGHFPTHWMPKPPAPTPQPQPTNQMNAEYHNPDGLTNEQVGVKDGWRLYVKLELKGKGDEWWSTRDGWRPVHTKHLGHLASDITTYRTRRPLPESATEPKEGGAICAGDQPKSNPENLTRASNAAAGTSNPFQYRRK